MKIRFNTCRSNFSKIPGSPIAYWASNTIFSLFANKSINDICSPKCGLKTGITDKYIKSWSEIDFKDIGFNCTSCLDSLKSEKKWFPVSNGKEFRKWYGNNYDVVYWFNDGYEIRHLYMPNGKLKSRPQNMDFYFKEGITWSALTSKQLSLRINPIGNIISGAGYGCFNQNLNLLPVMALLNSKVTDDLTEYLSGTLNFEVGVLSRIPVLDEIFTPTVSDLSQCNVDLEKKDWDSFETSWDFKKHPLI